MVRRVVGRGLTALEQLFSGFGTALIALLVLLLALATTALSLVGVGLLLAPAVLRVMSRLCTSTGTRPI